MWTFHSLTEMGLFPEDTAPQNRLTWKLLVCTLLKEGLGPSFLSHFLTITAVSATRLSTQLCNLRTLVSLLFSDVMNTLHLSQTLAFCSDAFSQPLQTTLLWISCDTSITIWGLFFFEKMVFPFQYFQTLQVFYFKCYPL